MASHTSMLYPQYSIVLQTVPGSPATIHENASWKSTASNVTKSHANSSLESAWACGFDKAGHIALLFTIKIWLLSEQVTF